MPNIEIKPIIELTEILKTRLFLFIYFFKSLSVLIKQNTSYQFASFVIIIANPAKLNYFTHLPNTACEHISYSLGPPARRGCRLDFPTVSFNRRRTCTYLSLTSEAIAEQKNVYGIPNKFLCPIF